MDPEDKKPRPERVETDDSLQAERSKTDEALTQRSVAVEDEADVVVDLARERADRLLESAREKADTTLRRETTPVEHADRIAVERASEDQALSEERATADEVLEAERVARAHAVAMLLRLEREETDENLLAERARSDESVASRDEFLAMVSHDTRNMLSGIAMGASLLTAPRGDAPADAGTTQIAQRILRLTARMNRLIGDLLDVVSMESGKLRVVFAESDAAQLLHETLEGFHAPAAAKSIEITSKGASGTVLANFDHERILQVLTNLVGNSMKFTKPGGHIELRLETTDDGLHFTVTDDGCGVTSDQLEAIFERFWQAGRYDRNGLGLGLYISRCIVEAHGGKIWAESQPGAGAAFHFTIPVAGPSQTAAAPT